jgi:hypothetical protein
MNSPEQQGKYRVALASRTRHTQSSQTMRLGVFTGRQANHWSNKMHVLKGGYRSGAEGNVIIPEVQ